MTRLIKLLEPRWRFTRNLGADFWNQFTRRLSSSNLPIGKFLSVVKPRCQSFTRTEKLRATYRADVLCYDSVILELKALGKLGDVETAQVSELFESWRTPKGLLINFGTRSLQHQRFVWSHEKSA